MNTTYFISLRGRRLKGKGKGVLERGFWARGKREKRARRKGGRETPARKPLELSGSIPEPAIRSGDTGQQKHFDSCQLIKTWMYNIKLQAPKLARKCEIKHWYACGAEGRKVGWSAYSRVIDEFSRMDRFSKL